MEEEEEEKEEVTLRLTVSQSVCLGIERSCGTCDQILLPVWNLQPCFCGAPSLTRGRFCLFPVSVSSNCPSSSFEVWWGYFTTDGQSVSQYVLVSSTLVGLSTRYYFLSECCCQKFAVLYLCGALSGERTGLQFAMYSLNVRSRAEPVTILYCLIWDSPNLEGQVLVFISLRNRVVQLYSSFLRLTGLRWRYCNPPPTWRGRSLYI
jgi:hypothetical protein